RRGRMLEMRISWVEHEGGRLKIQVDAIEAVVTHDAGDRRDEVGNALRIVECEVAAASAQGDHHFFALVLQPRDVVLELSQIKTGSNKQPQRSLRGGSIGNRKRNNHDVPLRRNIAEPKDRVLRSTAGPVSNQLMAV